MDINTQQQSNEFSLASTLEAILFYMAEPITLKKLAHMTKWDIAAVKGALGELQQKYATQESGIALIVHNDEASLVTTAAASKFIEAIAKEELGKELSRASLEVLSIVCYKGPLTRADIDYVRGVNSTFILRNLQMRGIVEKVDNPKDSRASFYAPTMQAFQFMGVGRQEDLPRFAEVQQNLTAFLSEREEGSEDTSEATHGRTKVTDELGSLDIERGIVIDDSAEDEAILCDTNNDGIMTVEECVPGIQSHISNVNTASAPVAGASEALSSLVAERSGVMEDDHTVDADIAEENLMGSEYIDEEVARHLTRDQERLEQDNNA